MKLTPLMISMLLFSGLALGVISFYGNVVDTYNPPNSTTTEEFGEFNDTFTEYEDKMSQLEEKTVGAATKQWTDWTKYQDAVMAFIGVGGVLFDVPNLMIRFVGTTGKFLPDVPTWFTTMLIVIIIVIFAMRISAIYSKTDEI